MCGAIAQINYSVKISGKTFRMDVQFDKTRMDNPVNTRRKLRIFLLLVGTCIACFSTLSGQEREKYILGEEQKLEMIVHVWGEVKKPGEYIVSDQTNVQELISKAGGPNNLANLTKVRLTRPTTQTSGSASNGDLPDDIHAGPHVEIINLKQYLEGGQGTPYIPDLQPGDTVFIPRNSLATWQTIVGFARDLAVIASVYFIAKRAAQE